MGGASSKPKKKQRKERPPEPPQRRLSLPPLAFANARSKEDKVQKAFDAMDGNKDGKLDPAEVTAYLLKMGYGRDECERFVKLADVSGHGCVDFNEFHAAWGFLNAFRVSKHTAGEVVRKPGSVDGKDLVVEDCKDCTVKILDVTAALQIDACENVTFVLGPCAGSARVGVPCSKAVAEGSWYLGLRPRLQELHRLSRVSAATNQGLRRHDVLPLRGDGAHRRVVAEPLLRALQRRLRRPRRAVREGGLRPRGEPVVRGLRLLVAGRAGREPLGRAAAGALRAPRRRGRGGRPLRRGLPRAPRRARAHPRRQHAGHGHAQVTFERTARGATAARRAACAGSRGSAQCFGYQYCDANSADISGVQTGCATETPVASWYASTSASTIVVSVLSQSTASSETRGAQYVSGSATIANARSAPS